MWYQRVWQNLFLWYQLQYYPCYFWPIICLISYQCRPSKVYANIYDWHWASSNCGNEVFPNLPNSPNSQLCYVIKNGVKTGTSKHHFLFKWQEYSNCSLMKRTRWVDDVHSLIFSIEPKRAPDQDLKLHTNLNVKQNVKQIVLWNEVLKIRDKFLLPASILSTVVMIGLCDDILL